MENLTKETFIEKVFDYENNKDWKFEGDKPTLIDWYTDWCNPCKALIPVLEELNEEYKDKVNIYKINVDDQHELGTAFGIKSVPSLLFIPMDEEPQMAQGGMTKSTLEKALKEILKVE